MQPMQPKPAFLGPRVASAFQDSSVVAAYGYRPPYPPAAFDILADLLADSPRPRRVLDVGCGTGLLARPLAGRADAVDGVDAVDVSPAMIDEGRRAPGGNHPHLTWIVGRAEEVALRPPYALITAGDSLHWLEWDVVMPRFARLLTPDGFLAILGVGQLPTPWDSDLGTLIGRYSTIRDYRPHDPVEEVEARGLFRRVGAHRTDPVTFVQSLDAYIKSFNGRASFSRERMGPAAASAFDAAVRALVSAHVPGDRVELRLVAEVVWGKPCG